MVLAVIQARMGSTRLPGKVLMPLAGVSVIEHIISRVSSARTVDDVIVATSIDRENLDLIRVVAAHKTRVFVGSENDVLDRYWQAVRLTDADHVVRITADCPAIDPIVIDAVVALHLATGADYTSNIDPPTWPDGLDTEVMTRDTLETAWREAETSQDREHVTPFVRSRPGRFVTKNLTADEDLCQHRWTLDKSEDYTFLEAVFDALYPSNILFGFRDVLGLVERDPKLTAVNRHIGPNARSKQHRGG